MALRWGVLAILLALGQGCVYEPASQSCQSGEECFKGEVCLQGLCQVPPDGSSADGPPPDGEGPEG